MTNDSCPVLFLESAGMALEAAASLWVLHGAPDHKGKLPDRASPELSRKKKPWLRSAAMASSKATRRGMTVRAGKRHKMVLPGPRNSALPLFPTSPCSMKKSRHERSPKLRSVLQSGRIPAAKRPGLFESLTGGDFSRGGAETRARKVGLREGEGSEELEAKRSKRAKASERSGSIAPSLLSFQEATGIALSAYISGYKQTFSRLLSRGKRLIGLSKPTPKTSVDFTPYGRLPQRKETKAVALAAYYRGKAAPEDLPPRKDLLASTGLIKNFFKKTEEIYRDPEASQEDKRKADQARHTQQGSADLVVVFSHTVSLFSRNGA